MGHTPGPAACWRRANSIPFLPLRALEIRYGMPRGRAWNRGFRYQIFGVDDVNHVCGACNDALPACIAMPDLERWADRDAASLDDVFASE